MCFLMYCTILCVGYAENAIKKDQIAKKGEALKKEEIQKILSFWNGIFAIDAQIVQINPDGSTHLGHVKIKKGSPEKARLLVVYDASCKQKLLAKGAELRVVDLSDGSENVYPLNMTPAGLILNPKLIWEKDIKVIEGTRQDKTIFLRLKSKRDDHDAEVVLIFSAHNQSYLPLAWRIQEGKIQEGQDQQGRVTEVILVQQKLRLNDEKTVTENFFQ